MSPDEQANAFRSSRTPPMRPFESGRPRLRESGVIRTVSSRRARPAAVEEELGSIRGGGRERALGVVAAETERPVSANGATERRAKSRGVAHGGEVPGGVGVRADDGRERIRDRQLVRDVRERSIEDPEPSLDPARVQDLDDELDVVRGKEPEIARVVGELDGDAAAAVTRGVGPGHLESEPAVGEPKGVGNPPARRGSFRARAVPGAVDDLWSPRSMRAPPPPPPATSFVRTTVLYDACKAAVAPRRSRGVPDRRETVRRD